jgi:hypothetical protein
VPPTHIHSFEAIQKYPSHGIDNDKKTRRFDDIIRERNWLSRP